MRNLLLLVFLGLFVAVHPTPTDSVTQIPVKLDEDIYHEVKAEEFIVDRPTALSGLNAQTTTDSGVDGKVSPPKTETPKTPVVIQSSQQLSSDVTTEGSGGSMERSGHAHTTPLSVSHAPTTQPEIDRFPAFLVADQSDFTTEGSADPTSSTLLLEGSGFSPSATTIQTSQQTFTAEGSGTTQSAALFEGGSRLSPTTTTTESVRDSTAAPPTPEPTEASTKTRASEKPLQKKNINSRLMQEKLSDMDKLANGDDYKKPHMHKGHTTPDWIIIVAFIAAVAALVVLCAAIATRDKWNHANQVAETKTPISNQKRELEMQTFPILLKDGPKENGSNGEYTVIPLDDITERFPSD